MHMQVVRHTPESWLKLIFSAKSAQNGGVIRRHVAWVEREIGRDLFESEVRRRGFHLIETGQQLVVICNAAPVRMLF